MRGIAIPVYALSRSDAADQSQYWNGLKGSVAVLAPLDESLLTRVFGVRGTPCTILIREGHVAAVLHGEIDERRQAWLLAQVS